MWFPAIVTPVGRVVQEKLAGEDRRIKAEVADTRTRMAPLTDYYP